MDGWDEQFRIFYAEKYTGSKKCTTAGRGGGHNMSYASMGHNHNRTKMFDYGKSASSFRHATHVLPVIMAA